MTLSMILRTLFEIFLFAAVVWGIYHEDRLVIFEKRIAAAVRRRRLKVAPFNNAHTVALKHRNTI